MTEFEYSKKFIKKYNKLNNKIKTKVGERLKIFSLNRFDQILNNHKLHGEYRDYFSLNVNADIRIVCKKISEERYFLLDIGTHSELYD